ncbi:MAG: hypothetical protein WD042_02075 [Phycisphaeraceae bacterium]
MSANMRNPAFDQTLTLQHDLEARLRELGNVCRAHGLALIEDQKNRLADEVDHLGMAGRAAAAELRANQQLEPAADYVDTAAGQVEQASAYLRQRHVPELADEARGAIRARPLLVLAGCFAAGMLLGRLLKAAPPAQGREQDDLADPRQPALRLATAAEDDLPPV